MSTYGINFGPRFPVFGLNTGKYGPEITPYMDTFHAVVYKWDHAKLTTAIKPLSENKNIVHVKRKDHAKTDILKKFSPVSINHCKVPSAK